MLSVNIISVWGESPGKCRSPVSVSVVPEENLTAVNVKWKENHHVSKTDVTWWISPSFEFMFAHMNK